jgi:hypothetical protein
MMMNDNDTTRLDTQLQQLLLHHIQSHYQALAGKAAEQQLSLVDYLAQLIEGEATLRENPSGGSITPASLCSKLSIPSNGVGPRRSIARKSRICSDWPLWQRRPTLSLLVTSVSAKLTYLLHSATPSV